jgi:hypothetical protein
LLADAGRPFWLCPGTSSWNTIVGRTRNMTDNCASAASAAVGYGAEGYLITDWGDNGHLQYLPVSEPGFAYGAAVSWCEDANHDIDLARALSFHVFDDPGGTTAGALLELGDAHRLVAPQVPNNSILAMHLYYPRFRIGDGLSAGMRDGDLEATQTAIADAREALAWTPMQRADAALVKAELGTSARLLDLLVRDARVRLAAGGRIEHVPAPARAGFAREVDGIVEEHRANWLARNRPGGLDDSCRRLEAYAEALRD